MKTNRIKTNKLYYAIICVSLALCIGLVGIVQIFARATEQKTYVEDVLIYECDSDDDAASEAKKYFEGKGYISTGIDLNPGTRTDRSAFLGYKTTTNSDMAITDIRLMAMDTGYQLYNYKEMVDYLASKKAGTAKTLYNASLLFAENYKAKSPRAKDAYEGLNLYNVENDEKTKLGDYILEGKADAQFFTKLLVKSSIGTINNVHGFLNVAIAPYENDLDGSSVSTANWANLAVKSELKKSIESGELTRDEINNLHKEYNDLARELFKAVQDFTVFYENAKSRSYSSGDENDFGKIKDMEDAVEIIDDVEQEDTDFYYLTAFEMLNGYAFEDGTKLGDWFVELGKETSDKVDLTKLYPIVEAMGDVQASLISSGGFVGAVMNLSENEANKDFEDALEEAKETINDYRKTDSIGLFENSDGEIENKTIAFTSDSVRKSSAENSIGKKSKWETFKEDFEKISEMLNLVVGILYVAIPVFKAVMIVAVAVTKLLAATCIALAALNTLCVWLLAVASFLNACLPWVSAFIMLFTIGVMIGIAIKEAIYGKEVDIDKHTPKPDFIFDAKEKGKEVIDIKYRAVRNNSGDVADINREKQIKWCMLAYTTDESAGSPLCADSSGNIFKCVLGSSDFVSGYDCARFFGERNPADCNSYCFNNKVSGCYLHYRTEESIEAENKTAETSESEESGETENQEEKQYIADMLIFTGKNSAEAKAKVTKHEGNYHLLDFNLSPDKEFATYIGYSITMDSKEAITDLRIAPYMGISQESARIMFGDIEYTRIDIVGVYVAVGDEQTKPQADALYYTKKENAGEPITADGLHPVTSYSDAKEGWIPVSMFGNDIPYNFNTGLEDFTNAMDAYVDDFRNTSPNITCYYSDEDHGLNGLRSVFLYYEGEKTYTEGTKYLSGVFFYGGFDWENTYLLSGDIVSDVSDYTERFKKIPNVILNSTNLASSIYKEEYISWLHNQAYIGFTYSYSPKRALCNIEAYEGDTYSDTLNYLMQKVNDSGKSMNYVASAFYSQQGTNDNMYNARFISPTNCFRNSKALLITESKENQNSYLNKIKEGYTKAEYDGVKLGYSKMHFLPTGLYVTGYQKGAKKLTLSDVVVSKNEYKATETNGKLSVDLSKEKALDGETAQGAFHGVTEMKNPRSKKPFNLGYPDFYKNDELIGKCSPLYLYISGSKYGKRKYITKLSVGAFSREQYKQNRPNASEEELKYVDAIIEGTALSSAASGCSDEVIIYNMATDKQSSAWYNKQTDGKADKEAPENKPAAYIGVSRTDSGKSESDDESESTNVSQKPITGVLLYELDDKTSPQELTVDKVKYYCAGIQTPIRMKGKNYFLYYTYSLGATPGEPIEEIKIDEVPIISGYATNLCADKDNDKPYGNDSQVSYIHLKYARNPKTDFYDKLYIGQGKTKQAAICDLISQGCVQYIDLNLNKGVDGNHIYLGYRVAHLDEEEINRKSTEKAKEKERQSQLEEAVYDVVITDDEPFCKDGIVRNNIYYYPVSSTSLTAGMGHRIYMYYACPWYSATYNSKNSRATYLPQDVFSGYYVNMALAEYDRVPYNTSLEATTETAETITPWEYVMLGDNSKHADFNVGAIAFKWNDDGANYAIDNRISMFAQRSDGSVKPSGEITGGFVGKTIPIGSANSEN